MLKWLKRLKNKDTGNSINIGGGGKNNISNKNYKILKIFSLSKALDKYNKSNFIGYNNIDMSINEYISKLRKKLILIEKLKQDSNNNNSNSNNNNNNSKIKISSSNNRLPIRSKEELFKKFGINKVKDMSSIIWNEPEQNGQKMTMALNLLQVPFIKFKINPREAFEEIDYIFSKKIRSINEMIYLQHLLTLYDVVPSIFINYDLIEPNEVMFNMAICLNMHKYKSNELIFKYGEYTDKLFFVLSGSVSLFEPIERSCEMDIDQYIRYLNQLESCEEYELIKKIIDINKVYKNDPNVLLIKNNNEKYIRKRYLQKIRAIKEIIKNQDYSTIEVNLNTEINSTIDTTEDAINLKEIISSEEYMRRIIPPNLTDIKEEEKIQNEKNNEKNDTINKSGKKKKIIKYYIYSFSKKVKPFNIFGEVILDDEENKNNINNSNSNNFKKRELTAICNEPSRILYLDINNWQKYFKNRQESIKMKNILTILDIPFLRHINIDYFKEKIFEHFSLFNYKIGEYIFKQNDKRKKIFFVVSGEVELIMNASINDINNIIEKKFDKDDIYYRNKLSESQKIKYIDSYYLINKLNKEKSTKTWRILGIYPKDIIGLNEILDENNCAYYVSAKCSSFNCEVYEIEYNKFKDMISENKNINKNVRNLFVQYTKNKMIFISKRLKALRTIYIKKKLKTYKNYLKTSFSCADKIKIKNTKSHFNRKLNLKLALFNSNILEPSSSSKNIHIMNGNCHSLNQFNLKTIYNYRAKGEKKSISINQNIHQNSSLKNAKLFNHKYKKSSNNTNYFNLEEFNEETKNKKRNQIKFESIFDSIKKNKLNEQINIKSNSLDKNKFSKTQTFFKTKSQRLIKFKDFNNLIKNHKNSKNKKYNLTQNSFFKNYLKEVKTIGVASAKKPEITPFSDILFSLADIDNKKNKNELKSATSSFIEYSGSSNLTNNVKTNSECQINTIDYLILDKIVDEEGYSKFIEKDLNANSINKSKSLKILRKQIKIINQKKKFPPHLIRRFEANRKINYFPEKLLNFVK